MITNNLFNAYESKDFFFWVWKNFLKVFHIFILNDIFENYIFMFYNYVLDTSLKNSFFFWVVFVYCKMFG